MVLPFSSWFKCILLEGESYFPIYYSYAHSDYCFIYFSLTSASLSITIQGFMLILWVLSFHNTLGGGFVKHEIHRGRILSSIRRNRGQGIYKDRLLYVSDQKSTTTCPSLLSIGAFYYYSCNNCLTFSPTSITII